MSQTKFTFSQSLGFAINGIKIATKYNKNIRIHLVIAIIVLVCSIILQMQLVEMAVIAMMVLLVISAELINTAIEEVIDLVTKDYREEARIAKDVSAGMVLIVSTGSVLVGFLIFTPYVLNLFI